MSYTYRFATPEDLSGYFELYRRESIEVFGGYTGSLDEIESEWKAPGFDPAKMMLLVFPAAGATSSAGPIAYAEVRAFHTPPVRLYCYGYVDVEHRGKGIGTELLSRAEAIAPHYYSRVPGDARVVFQAFSSSDEGKALLAESGYRATRNSLIMDRDFDAPPDVPVFPEGFRLRSMADGLGLDDFVRVKEEGFRDHRGSVEQPFEAALETWRHIIDSSRRIYEPSWIMVLYDGDTPAGELAMWTETEEDADKSYVQSLAVLPAYRRRGLATALLRHAFVLAWKRGKKGVSLSVDGSSLTGANLLYEKAGMYVKRVFTAFEKEMRPGVEISRQ